MNRATVMALVLVSGTPVALAGQASQFGVRALGLPSLPVSARGHGTGGAIGLFDPESAINPASLSRVTRSMASFNLLQSWRTSENRFGRTSGNDSQFPLFFAAGPIGSRLVGSVSASVYADRTFGLSLEDSLVLRDVPVVAYDTIHSRGGISDLRAGLAYRIGPRAAVGLGLHILTGTNRIEFRRHFSDSNYAPVRLRNELSFAGFGVSVGALVEPVVGLQLAAFARLDGDLSLDRDTTDIGDLSLPRSLGAGVRWQAARQLILAGHFLTQTWSRLDEDLKARGGVGAVNTVAVAGGLEWFRSATRPGRLPIRAGVRWGQLPFPVEAGADGGSELAIALGTGFRFAGDRGSVDVAVERTWRDEGTFRERANALKLGIGIRQ
jgi:long-subunit fatty acid transport protein